MTEQPEEGVEVQTFTAAVATMVIGQGTAPDPVEGESP